MGLKDFIKRTKKTQESLDKEQPSLRHICLSIRRKERSGGGVISNVRLLLNLLKRMVRIALLHQKGFSNSYTRRLMVGDIDHGYHIIQNMPPYNENPKKMKDWELVKVSCLKNIDDGERSDVLRADGTLFGMFQLVYDELIEYGSRMI